MMTDVIPTFLRVDPGSLSRVPTITRWQHRDKGLRSVAGLKPNISRHELTTAMHHLHTGPGEPTSLRRPVHVKPR